MGRIRQLPNPETCSFAELELAIDCCPDQKAQKRLNPIHLLLCGSGFDLALRHSRVSERCLQVWIARFNQQGIGGITYRPRPGRPRSLDPARVAAEILPVVDDPALAGERHWTAVKFCGWLRQERGLDLSYPPNKPQDRDAEFVVRYQPSFPCFPVRPNGWLRGLLQKANS